MHLYVMQSREDKNRERLLGFAREAGIKVESVSRQTLDCLTHEANHQGVAALCAQADALSEADLPALLASIQMPPLLLVLDGVQDPHNFGACFRSADAAGVHAIIAPKDKAVGITPVVSKVASGAAETVPFVQVTNLARSLGTLKEHGVWVYGAASEADQSVYDIDLTVPVALVLGAEGSGLRRLTRELCDGLVKIPMQGNVASLNVSVAAGVLLFEAVRQRRL